MSAVSYVSQPPLLSAWDMFTVNVALAGLQFTWSVELGYGSPYLLSLGLPKPLLSLVWLAGPLSGFIIQPLIGAVSDRNTSAWGRRRPFIVVGSLLVILAIAVIAYAQELAHFFGSTILGWSALNPETRDKYAHVAIILAVVSFYVLDFSINAVQACLRALVLDVAPLAQQEAANAYAGRMLMFGSSMGYFMGFVNLVEVFPFLGRSQMQILCVIGIMVFILAVFVTCLTTTEQVLDKSELSEEELNKSIWSTIADVYHAFWLLPQPLQQVCNVQFFSWMGWFPFLFYSTTWVVEVVGRHYPGNPADDPDFFDYATRLGSFALFLWSIGSFVASVVLPWFIPTAAEGLELALDLPVPAGDHEAGTIPSSAAAQETSPLVGPAPASSPRGTVRDRVLATLRLFQFSMRRLYTFSLTFFSVVMMCTYFVQSAKGAVLLIVLASVPWAVSLWVPFALVGEFMSKMNIETQSLLAADDGPGVDSAIISPLLSPTDRTAESQIAALPNLDPSHRPTALTIPTLRHGCLSGSPSAVSSVSNSLARTDGFAEYASSPLSRRSVQFDETPRVLHPSSPTAQPADGGAPLSLPGPPDSSRLFPGSWHDFPRTETSDSRASVRTRRSRRSQRTTGTAATAATTLDSGMVLGIHNMYVVLPQFVMSLVSTVIFSALQDRRSTAHPPGYHAHPSATVDSLATSPSFWPTVMASGGFGGSGEASDAVGWVLRVGGLCSLVAAFLSLYIVDMRKVRMSDYI
ncbi:hypothetical protein IWQ60_005275 [Tieghemiomyces parasiticus]|uniref:Sucrose transporter n=1 Tax=Tieghemiomyces parasiticus TaxID=78921 RepID=A0A9W8DYD5_9FUNG|nr:hypothetical protein IWQ60_005275 [Tieghemiomyces parasiticus]